MSTPMLMTDHPTEETLAAFVDHRLEAHAQQETMRHLADCGECREIVLMAADFQHAEKVVTPGFGKRRIAGIAAAIAIAAGLAVVFLPAMMQPKISDVIEAAQNVDARPSLGRLSGDYAYKGAPSTPRGVDDSDDANYQMLQIVVDAKNPHVRGVARLFVAAEPAAVDVAIAELRAAHAKAKGEQRDAIAIDLAAALLRRARWTAAEGQPDPAQLAYELSNEVFTRTRGAEAAWNRAAALELLQRHDEAVAAYNNYLALDPQSEWAKEARRRIEYLKE